MMPAYITGYRWCIFPGQRDEGRPRFESWPDIRVTVRMLGKEYVYSATWSKYPPETEPAYEPLRDVAREIEGYVRKMLRREEEPRVLRRLLAHIELSWKKITS